MVGISQAVGVATHPSEHSTVCIVLLEEFFCVTHIARGHHDCEFHRSRQFIAAKCTALTK